MFDYLDLVSWSGKTHHKHGGIVPWSGVLYCMRRASTILYTWVLDYMNRRKVDQASPFVVCCFLCGCHLISHLKLLSSDSPAMKACTFKLWATAKRIQEIGSEKWGHCSDKLAYMLLRPLAMVFMRNVEDFWNWGLIKPLNAMLQSLMSILVEVYKTRKQREVQTGGLAHSQGFRGEWQCQELG